MKKNVIFFIFTMLFLLFSTDSLFCIKNVNIDKAKQLIKEKKYKEAKYILSIELVNDPKNEDEIIKLINKIEALERENYKNMENAIKSIEEGNVYMAKEFFDKIDTTGDYTKRLKETIEISKRINDTIITNNNFINFINKGERSLLEFDLNSAFNNYISALNIYRLKKENILDKNFEEIVTRIHNIEKRIASAGIDIQYINYSSDMNIKRLTDQFTKMQEKIKEWTKIEEELLAIEKELQNVDEKTKAYIEFQAYSSIVEKFIFYIRRGVQKYAIELYKNIVKYSDETLSKRIEEIDFVYKEISDIYNTLLVSIDYYMFYRIISEFQIDLYISRSRDNIIRYLDFLTYKNNYLATIYYLYVRSPYLKAIENLKDYEKYLQDSDIDLAEKSLNKTKEIFNELSTKKREYDKIMNNLYNYNQLEEYSKSFERYRETSNQIASLNKNIQIAYEAIANIKFTTNRYRNQADSIFNEAVKSFNNKQYDSAMEKFKESKELYLSILTKNKTKEIYDRVDLIDKYLKDIDNIIYYRDIQQADEYYTKAKINFYRGDYDNAKNFIDKADELYKKYNEDNTLILELQERINSAVKLKSETILSRDDPAYPYIMELYNNALNNYNNKNYDKAREIVTQILVEKPYYEEARKLEAMILKSKNDRVGFIEIYRKYKEQAIEKYKAGVYNQALQEFRQLLIFEEDVKEINGYIQDCLKKLRFVKTEEVTEEEKTMARNMVKNAEKFYAEKDFNKALREINNAIQLWEDVPGAKDLRYKILLIVKGTKEEQKLSRENEIRYKKAEEAYKNKDYDTTIALTDLILKTQDSPDARKLNELARRRKEQESQ